MRCYLKLKSKTILILLFAILQSLCYAKNKKIIIHSGIKLNNVKFIDNNGIVAKF